MSGSQQNDRTTKCHTIMTFNVTSLCDEAAPDTNTPAAGARLTLVDLAGTSVRTRTRVLYSPAHW